MCAGATCETPPLTGRSLRSFCIVGVTVYVTVTASQKAAPFSRGVDRENGAAGLLDQGARGAPPCHKGCVPRGHRW